MLRISALNDSASSDDDQENKQLTKTKEAKEAEAFAVYNKALSHQQKGNTLHAEKLLRNLFDHPLLQEASSLVEDESQAQIQNNRGLQLLYSIHKNLASILLQRNELKEAMAAYIEAVKIDSSEVTVWFKMGQVARKLNNYPLAKICYLQALQCNPNHWPSLDNAITITFALGDYLTCLEHISTALEKDCNYPKGLALRKQILLEQPSLESLTKDLFVYCDPKIHTVTVDKDESKEIIGEALKIRAKRRQMVSEDQEKELRPVAFRNPLTPFTWKNVGEQLIDLYDFATTSNPPKSLGLEVDLRDYFFLDQSVFLGKSCTNETEVPPKSEEKDKGKRLSGQFLKKVGPEAGSLTSNSAFQRAQEWQSVNVSSLPESLSIGNNTKESALLRRLHGHGQGTTTPGFSDIDSKEKNATEINTAENSVGNENDLDAMDVEDGFEMPLLRAEDMDIDALNLQDIQKTDFNSELLLKANDDDDLLGLSDAKSLDKVLSSVIDMQFGEEMEQSKISAAPPVLDMYTSNNAGSTSNALSMENKLSDEVLNKADIPLAKSSETSVDLSKPLQLPRTNSETKARNSSIVQNETQQPEAVTQASPISGNTPASVPDMPSAAQPSPPQAHTSPAITPLRLQISTAQNSDPPPAHTPPPKFLAQLPLVHSSNKAPPAEIPEVLPLISPLISPSISSSTKSQILPPPSTKPVSSPSPQTLSVQSLTITEVNSPHISPPPAHTASSSSREHGLPFQSPPPAHTSNISTPQQTHIAKSDIHSLAYESCTPKEAHMQSSKPLKHSHTDDMQALSLASSSLTSTIQQPDAVPVTRTIAEQILQEPTSKISILPTDQIHSPIAASLLSPNSTNACSKSASVYHSVLSSIEQSETDTSQHKTSPVVPSIKDNSKSVGQSSESPHREERTPQKSSSHTQPHHSPQSCDRRSAGDLIEDVVRSHLKMDSSREKQHSPKVHQSPQHSSPVHAYHSPVLTQSSSRSPKQQQTGLVSPSSGLPYGVASTKALSQHHSTPPLLSPVDAPSSLPYSYHGTNKETFRERSGSVNLPLHHINTLSAIEAEALLKSTSDQSLIAEWTRERLMGQNTGSSHSRPPTLSRSSSLPGHYNYSTDLLPPYLSPPPLPSSSSSPCFSSRRQSHSKSYQGVNFPPLLTTPLSQTAFPTYLPPSQHQDVTSLPYSAGLFPPSLPQLSPPTTLPSSLSKHTSEALLLHGKALASNSSATYFQSERNPYDCKSSQAKSTSPHHHHPSKSPSHSSTMQQLAQSFGLPQATSQLQSLTRLAQHPPLTRDEALFPGDHSYHQKRSVLFQAMVESMLASSIGPSMTSIPQTQTLSSKSARPDTVIVTMDAGKKRVQGGGGGSKRGPKRKSDEPLSDDWTNAHKRRSTRSRNTRNKKEEKSVDYQKLMKKYFPKSLLNLEVETDPEKGSDLEMEVDEKNPGSRSTVDLSTLKHLTNGEEEDVKAYIKNCLKGHGILDLIYKFLLHLARKFECIWYEGVSGIYIKLYDRLRKHLTIPTIFGDDNGFTPDGLKDYAAVILTSAELYLNEAFAESGSKSFMSPSKIAQPDPNIVSLLGKFHNEDMQFLLSLTDRDDALGSSFSAYCARFYWLKAKQHQLLNETADAVFCFEILAEVLEGMRKEADGSKTTNGFIIIPYFDIGKVISLGETTQQLESLQRCKSLEDTQKMYDQGHYEQVVNSLMSTFSKKQSMSPKSMAQKERPSQLLLLLDSLYNLKRKSECMQWSEVFLNEAILHYKRVPTIQLRHDWAATLVSLFASMDRVMDEDESILKDLSGRNLVRLAHNLVSVIEISLDVADAVTEMPIGSVLPWKILYRILKFEELKNDSQKQVGTKAKQNEEKKKRDEGENEEEEESEEELNPSLAMLVEAHEYLGRHSWCTKDEGLLLLFSMSVLEKEMEGKEDVNEELAPAFEQCVYCLYGHPNKKGRARHLSDHNTTGVALTWEKAGPVFHHFAPLSVPEFDSYKTSTVSSDVENLFRRIYALVPEKLSPAQYLSSVTDYIEGMSTISPRPLKTTAFSKDKDTICSQLYYLLGDFYFKNKEPAKAVKFYQLDVVYNHDRLDSWAGLALAKMSQIEQKLNSTELKIEAPIHKKSEAALRCFRRAVELEEGSRKLWLEYGSLAYQLHSHASRQIRYKDMLPIGADVVQVSRLRTEEMLIVARNSYVKANECEGDGTDEDWLTHYMMGKIAEKQRENPKVYLEHYKQAALCLHEEQAVYPKKIQFASLPPHLALEALEVFYRIHAASLKLVLTDHCDHLSILVEYVTGALESHFARGEEKQEEKMEEEIVEDLPSVKSTPTDTVPEIHKPKHVYVKNPLDHEYSRHKSTSDSQSEGEDPKNQVQGPPAGNQTKCLTLSSNPEQHKLVKDPNSVSVSKDDLDPENKVDTAGDSVALSKSDLEKDIADGLLPSKTVSGGNTDGGERGSTIRNKNSSNDDERMERQDEDLGRVEHTSSTQAETLKDETEESKLEVDSASQTWQVTEMETEEKQMTDNVPEKAVDEMISFNDNLKFNDGEKIASVEKKVDLKDLQGKEEDSLTAWKTSSGETKSVKEEGQYDSQVESSEEDASALSCDNDGDIDTDAIDDDTGSISTMESEMSQSSTKDHPGFFSQASQDEREGVGGFGDDGEEMMEVHAGDSDTSGVVVPWKNAPQLSCIESEGFSPQQDTDDAMSEKLMDVDANVEAESSKAIDKDVNDGEKGPTESMNNDEKKDNFGEELSSKGESIAVKESQEVPNETTDQAKNSGNYTKDVSMGQNSIAGPKDSLAVSAPDVSKQMIDESGDLKKTSVDSLKSDNLNDKTRVNSLKTDDQNDKNSMAPIRTDDQPDKKSVDPLRTGEQNDKTSVVSLKTNDQNDKTSVDSLNTDDQNDKASVDPLRTYDQNKTAGYSKEEKEKWEVEDKEKSYKESGAKTDKKESEAAVEDAGNRNQDPALETNTNSDTATQQKHDTESTSQNNSDGQSSKDPILLKGEIISKCISGLELCAGRFSSHYKSLYRLAHLYYSTKNLNKARDILLGCPDWQEQAHMPAPGLFSERKQNNFFQGLWKIPIDDIDRSGCFATHVHRSVRLLLNVLADLGDLDMLKHVRHQLRRTPDTGKKYLRDAERTVLADEAFLKCVMVVQQDMNANDQWSESQREENLARIYRLWLSGKGGKHSGEATDALHKAFRIMMKGKTDVNRLTSDQAIIYCQQNLSKALTPSTPSSSQPQSKSNSQSATEKSKNTQQQAPVMSLEESERDKWINSQSGPSGPSLPQQQNVKSQDSMSANTFPLHIRTDYPLAGSEKVENNQANTVIPTSTDSHAVSMEVEDDVIVISDPE